MGFFFFFSPEIGLKDFDCQQSHFYSKACKICECMRGETASSELCGRRYGRTAPSPAQLTTRGFASHALAYLTDFIAKERLPKKAKLIRNSL